MYWKQPKSSHADERITQSQSDLKLETELEFDLSVLF